MKHSKTLLDNIQKAEDESVRKERFEKELAITHELQESLFPSALPKVNGLDYAGQFYPTEVVQGDFYTVKKETEHLFLGIGRVGSMNIPACFYAYALRSLLQSHFSLSMPVDEILEGTHHTLVDEMGEGKLSWSALSCIFDETNPNPQLDQRRKNSCFDSSKRGNLFHCRRSWPQIGRAQLSSY